MARFLYLAQDRNMTNGDFAWFTFRPMRTSHSDRPWDWYAPKYGCVLLFKATMLSNLR